jgi:hypothetical protein
MKTNYLLFSFATAFLAGCSSLPAEKKTYLLIGNVANTREFGPVVVNKIPFSRVSGKTADFNNVVTSTPELKRILEGVFQAVPPTTKTTVQTYDEMVSHYLLKEMEPEGIIIKEGLKDHSAVVLSYRRDRPTGFWNRLFGR